MKVYHYFQSYLTKRYPSALKANHCPLKQSRLPVADERQSVHEGQHTHSRLPKKNRVLQELFFQHLRFLLVYITHFCLDKFWVDLGK